MIKENTQISDIEYQMARRHTDYFIKRVIDSDDALYSIRDLQDLLIKEIGFRIQKRTIRNYIDKCLEKYGDAPLEELFRLNPKYFEKQKVKPPNPYGSRKKE